MVEFGHLMAISHFSSTHIPIRTHSSFRNYNHQDAISRYRLGTQLFYINLINNALSYWHNIVKGVGLK